MGPMSYEGPEKYIFISYAHKDSEQVIRILEKLTEAGYRIWYDDGIAPGSEWPEDIATHLDGCAVFMAFVSNNSIASSNCRREVTFALSRQKDFLGVVLEPTKMSLGMEMQLSAQQCILRYNYKRESDFIQKIFSCPDLECCKIQPEPVEEEIPAPQPAPKPTPKPVPKPKPAKAPARKRGKLSLPLIIALAVLAAALIITPIVFVITSNLPIQVAEDASFSPREDSVSLRGKVITADSAKALNRLENLQFLYFYDCTFEDGAMDTFSAPELRIIKVENGNLPDYGFLMDSTKLNTLELVNAGVTNDNVPFAVFTDLQYLNLSGNGGFSDLSAIPVENLRNVDLSGTAVADVSALADTQYLTEIRCANTKLTSIDPLASLTSLKIMDFTGCQIQRVATPFQSLSVRELYMGGNTMTTAEGFENFTVLEKAYLADNHLANVDWLGKSAATLTELDLRNNLLYGEDIPFLANCKSLTYLDISGLELADLDLVANLLQLKTLAASDCGLKSISGIGALGKLQQLHLDGNELTDITGLPNIGGNKNVVLDLSHNEITSIASLTDGEYLALCLVDNPLVYAEGDFEGLSGTRVYLVYDESLNTCGATAFKRVFLQDCPADKQLGLKQTFASNMAYVSQEEMTAELESQGISHPYAN